MLFYCCTARWAIYVLFHAGLMAAAAAKCAQRTPKRSHCWVQAAFHDPKAHTDAEILPLGIAIVINSLLV